MAFADSGVGIAPEDLSRVMEPLYSTKARGLGLGLALARAIVEKHRGTSCARKCVGPRQHVYSTADHGAAGSEPPERGGKP